MKKILVAYATRARSTIDIAEVIGRVLMGRGTTVDIQSIKTLRDVTGYDAIVIGSAIRTGQWLPEAVEFVTKNAPMLQGIPTAYFVVSGLLRNDTPEIRQSVLAYLDPVRRIAEPVSIGLFAGKIDYNKLSSLDRAGSKNVSAVQGDWRDWEGIRAWARELQRLLLPRNPNRFPVVGSPTQA